MRLPKHEIICENCGVSGEDNIFHFTWHEWGIAPVVKCECFVCEWEWDMTESELDGFCVGWFEATTD